MNSRLILSVAAAMLVASAAHAATQNVCVVGGRVLAEPGNHPAKVLAASAVSCRVHYEDGAFPDSWVYDFNIKAIDKDAKDAATAAKGPRPGRYNIAIGSGFYDGYITIRPGGSYELFLPGGRSAGAGRYAFDQAGVRMRWLSGPLADRRWDGSQKLEGDGAMLKIRIGKAAVATNTIR